MKKKPAVRMLAMLCVLTMSMTLIGCQGKKGDTYSEKNVSDSENTLDIVAIEKGYGTKWLYALADAYKEKHPEVEITITTETEDTNITNKLEMGADYSRYDLFFAGTDVRSMITSALNGDEEKAYLADLTEVYEAAPDGKKIKDTLDPSLLAAFQYENDGKEVYYTMPWVQTVAGLLANDKVLIDALGENWEDKYPVRTTNELVKISEKLAEKNVPAFIHAAATSYYQFLYEVWWAQYEGLENIENFYSGRYFDEVEQKMKIGPEIFNQQGRLEAMKVMEATFGAGYSDEKSNSYTWNETQTHFMLGDSAFFSNGDWNNLEMEKSFPDNQVRFLRTPIVSSLGTKLGITEEQLCQIIDYVDAVLDGKEAQAPSFAPTGSYTAEQVIEEVKKARTLTYTYSNYHAAFAASYGKGLEHAKEFLIFMASEEGQEIFAKAMNGPTLPYGYDVESNENIWSGYSDYAKSRWMLAKNATYQYTRTDKPLGATGINVYRAISKAPIEVLFCHEDSNMRMTAQEIYEEDYAYYKGSTTWEDLLRRAGMLK